MRLPSTSASISTGGKAAGIEAEASSILRTRVSARRCPLAAMAPMFQITGRITLRFIVPISSSRPLLYARAMATSMRSSTWRAISR